ncbi:copper chaperone PCu(A)C [Streptomyces sp. NBC_01217]|uniref:copper chaperone PCu(A)C n=1 Tax=Streptomyces sp. NBC_01217 TaxID=2903779 RepID=UPI002E128299|nr:copper chaperone PCu(A)C [Streptomyces sp. NBC_01217]
MRTTTTTSIPWGSRRLRALAAASAAAALGMITLAGCSTDSPSPSGAAGSATASPGKVAATAAPVTMRDPWVKVAESGMAGAFGTLVNSTGADITVVSATSGSSEKMELHEVADVDGKTLMRPKEGGFVIPAKGSHTLEPGSDHLMLMGLTRAMKPGDEIPVTLAFKDGRTLKFTAVAKEFAGGKENYDSGTSDMKKD